MIGSKRSNSISNWVKASIGRKIFIYLMIFSLLIIGIIGLGTRFILPAYYYNRQVDYLDRQQIEIESLYKAGDIDTTISIMEEMETTLGGELYFYDETSGQQSNNTGKGKNRTLNASTERFISSGDVSIYSYVNKIGLDVRVIGLLIDDSYLVYEVSIQSISDAVSTMIEFLWILLGIVLILAVLVSLVLSRNISKPILSLNELAESMKTRQIEAYLVTEGSDEIARLNQTLNELYEALRGNIYKLNAELNKERNAENLKKRFLAQATHELKTPIAVIRGYAEILYDGMYKDEEERERFLQNIYDETESVSHLILDVLDYTKMETGNYQLKSEPVRVVEQLSGYITRYKDYVASNGLDYQAKILVPESFVKEMDYNRYVQIFKNLISNAVEHGKSYVKVELEVVGSKLKLTVTNDGLLIKDEDINNIFESFYKTSGKSSGTGLGLAIVKEIVSLHQGEYRVENTLDGVKFVIII